MYLPEIQLETLRAAKADLVKTESATPAADKAAGNEKSPFQQQLDAARAEQARQQEKDRTENADSEKPKSLSSDAADKESHAVPDEYELDRKEYETETNSAKKSLSYKDFFKSNDFFGPIPAEMVFDASLSDETAEPLQAIFTGEQPLETRLPEPDEISERIANLFLFSDQEIPEELESSLLAKSDNDETEKERDSLLSLLRTAERPQVLEMPSSNAMQGEEIAAGIHAENGLGKKLVGGDDALIKVVDERADSVAESLFAPKEDQFITKVSFPENGAAEMQLSLTDSGQALVQGLFDNPDGKNAAPQQESLFSSMLSAEIEKAAGDFVKAGSIVLRDNNAGNINLVLHPDSLGDVKIHLKLTDNVIAGHILVTSEDAYHAFKNSIESLKAAFQSGGFEAGQFDLSWSQNDSGNGQQQKGNTPWKNSLAALREYDDANTDAVPIFGENTYSRRGRAAVDMIACLF
jgi:flagellar hook-length control protein FliK